jgi:hypothetical protein
MPTGTPTSQKVALREASEESGFRQHRCSVLGGLFDIDIHPIPANPKKNEPAHEHFDLRYLLELDDALPLPLNPEGLTLRWMGVDEAASLVAGSRACCACSLSCGMDSASRNFEASPSGLVGITLGLTIAASGRGKC